MTAGAETGRTSPVHVHVERDTPVHVHLKKKKKGSQKGIPKAVEERLKSSHRRMAGLVEQPKTKKSPVFIPPPGKTSKRGLSWEGKTHQLEIPDTDRNGAMKMDELNTSEEEDCQGKARAYERKIDGLLSEVGTLKSELDLQKSARIMGKKDEQLNMSRKLLEEQEDEIHNYRKELEQTVKENEALRHSMEKTRDLADMSKNELEYISDERDRLLKKLVEVEMDGRAATEQVEKLRQTVHKLKEDKRLSASDMTALTRQRENLVQKMEEFEKTNKTLRLLLKEHHKKEEDYNHLTSKNEVLMKKLTETEATHHKMSLELEEKERQIDALLTQVDADKDQAVAFDELKKTMESTRGHLQNQLRSKEMENNRLTVHLKSLEQQLENEKLETEHLQGLLGVSREKSVKEKEALKKAARVQKDRAIEREREIEELKELLKEKEAQLAKVRGTEDELRDTMTQLSKDRITLESENSACKSRVQEMQQVVESSERSAQATQDTLQAKLSARTQEVNSLRMENEQLKSDISALEDRIHSDEQRAAAKVSFVQTELQQLKASLRQYESLTTEYKDQIEKYRREAEDCRERLYENEQETTRLQQESLLEGERSKIKLQQRISDLEPLADLLKTTELKLQDAQERLLTYERRSGDHAKLIAELTKKVEMQTDQLENMREKWRTSQDDNRSLQSKIELLERKCTECEQQNREMVGMVSKREETLRVCQERLEEQRAENARMTLQLENSLAEARRQTESQREKSLAKERAAQARIMDLEAQLSRSTASSAQLKRTKEEAERRFNSRLNDMRDRLEQANSTTRSMQNYVAFLKSSYSNVFEDEDGGRIASPTFST